MTSAIEAWKERIEAHNEQTVRTRGGVVYEDMWSTMAQRFKDDPRRTDDAVVNLLMGWLTPESTVLDVGGGAGTIRVTAGAPIEAGDRRRPFAVDAGRAAGVGCGSRNREHHGRAVFLGRRERRRARPGGLRERRLRGR